MDKIFLLSRVTQKIFIQLGRKFNLPLDIIFLLYNILRKSIDYDDLYKSIFIKIYFQHIYVVHHLL